MVTNFSVIKLAELRKSSHSLSGPHYLGNRGTTTSVPETSETQANYYLEKELYANEFGVSLGN